MNRFVTKNQTTAPEYQLRFRRAFDGLNPAWYNGYVHLAFIYGSWLAALWIFIQLVSGPVLWWEWSAFGFGFAAGIVIEWFVHRSIMHRPCKSRLERFLWGGLKDALHQGHEILHHTFFTDQEMRFRTHRDWRTVLLPPYVQAFLIFTVAPAVYIISLAVSDNFAVFLMCTTVTMYAYYETAHMAAHTGSDMNSRFIRWFARSVPFVNTVRRHHKAHHVPKHKKNINMGLMLPVSDWMFGTSDLNRGLFGHLINGDSTEYVKKQFRNSAWTADAPGNGQRP